jgi:glycosyltransferase involved in cell wall biosynthesis
LKREEPLRQQLDPNQTALAARDDRAGLTARSIVLLLDLSGSPDAARAWAGRHLDPAEIRSVAKADLKWGSKLAAIKQLRLMQPDVFLVFCSDLTTQSAVSSIQIFGALAGARIVMLADRSGSISRCSRFWALLGAPLVLGLQLALGYILLGPLTWLFTFALEYLSPVIRAGNSTPGINNWNKPLSSPARQDVSSNEIAEARSATAAAASASTCTGANAQTCKRTGLYLRATPASAQVEGGMATHVAGFTGGAAALGHHLDFITSGPLHTIPPTSEVHLVPLSGTLSATRALFELWNSITFTLAALRIYRQHCNTRGWEFIYQRYNRFNCTGVLLSTLTGLPLLLEYNGSEVWVGRNWDPIGMTPLLKRFERINQRRSDLIIVVSSTESSNLQALGVPPDRILVNPNGVDTTEFHPGCGGFELRSELGLTGKAVVGFIGSFGPWHGTQVLAQAAIRLGPNSGCHFLFVGTGDFRAQTELIVSEAHCSSIASFAGGIPHSSIPQYLDACDILVAPHVPMPDGTPFFGSPTKLFEYLAMARPIVASRLGQMSEILTDDDTAILVEPGDPHALAGAILRLAMDEPLRRRLGENARSIALSNYTWRHNAARVFSALQPLVDRGVEPDHNREALAGDQAGA